MATFLQIQDEVKDYLIDLPSATVALIPKWINKAMRAAQDRHNFPAYASLLSVETAIGTRVLANKPSDWKEFRELPWLEFESGGSGEICWASSKSEMIRLFPEDEDTAAGEGGEPRFILETDTTLEVYPEPDDRSLWPNGNHRVRIPYWSRQADMTADADTNFFTERLEQYLIFKAVADGMIFNREEQRGAVYVERAEQELDRAIRLDKRAKLGERLTFGVHTGVHGTRFSPGPGAQRYFKGLGRSSQ